MDGCECVHWIVQSLGEGDDLKLPQLNKIEDCDPSSSRTCWVRPAHNTFPTVQIIAIMGSHYGKDLMTLGVSPSSLKSREKTKLNK